MENQVIINSLLAVVEGDERSMDFYLTGILQPIRKLYADIADDKKVEFAIPESEVRELIKNILKAILIL